MGHLSINWAWSRKKRNLGATVIMLAKRHVNGFQIDGSLNQMQWIMNNVKGAFFKLEEFDAEGAPEALLFIAPDELALVRLVREM